MLLSYNNLEDATIKTRDGKQSSLIDCLVDDQTWLVKYLVVDPGKEKRNVFVSPGVTFIDTLVGSAEASTPEEIPEPILSLSMSWQELIDNPIADETRMFSIDKNLLSFNELSLIQAHILQSNKDGELCDIIIDDRTWEVPAIAISIPEGEYEERCIVIASNRLQVRFARGDTTKVEITEEQIASALPYDPDRGGLEDDWNGATTQARS